jgi:hypothetical protein
MGVGITTGGKIGPAEVVADGGVAGGANGLTSGVRVDNSGVGDETAACGLEASFGVPSPAGFIGSRGGNFSRGEASVEED